MSDISNCDIKMPQNNGLLVDVDIEPVKSENENRTDATNVTFDVGGGGGGENEVNSNVASVNKNIFDAIDSIQIEAIGASAGKQRERMNSVDSTHSIRSYDSTGLSLEENYMENISNLFLQELNLLIQEKLCSQTWATHQLLDREEVLPEVIRDRRRTKGEKELR